MKKKLENARYTLLPEKPDERTALQHFAEWLKDVPKNPKISVTASEKTIVFIRQDIK